MRHVVAIVRVDVALQIVIRGRERPATTALPDPPTRS
jgi:hypothetical protein